MSQSISPVVFAALSKPLTTDARESRAVPAVVELYSAKVMPANAHADAVFMYLFMLTLLGASKTTDMGFWKTYVASYTLAAFPSLAEHEDITASIALEQVPDQVVDSLAALRDPVTDPDAQGEVIKQLRRIARRLFPDSEMDEILRTSVVEIIGDACAVRAMYAHYSLIIFLAGKVIGAQNIESLYKRAAAQIATFRIVSENDAGTVSALNGALKISVEAAEGINRAWFEMSSFRIPVLTEVVRGCATSNQIAFEVISVVLGLLDFVGMSHAIFIRDLLASDPWVKNYAPLAAMVSLFEESARSLLEVDAVLRPYVKLIYGARAKIFLRRDLLLLIECAAADKRDASTTMRGYFSDISLRPGVDAFRAERERRRRESEPAPGRLRRRDDDDSVSRSPVRRRRARSVTPPPPPARPIAPAVQETDRETPAAPPVAPPPTRRPESVRSVE